MIAMAQSNVNTNKLLAFLSFNIGRFIVYIFLNLYQSIFSAMSLAGVMSVYLLSVFKSISTQGYTIGVDATYIYAISFVISFITAFFIEFLVLLFHLSGMHKTSLYVLIALSFVNWIKILQVVFAAPTLMLFSIDGVISLLVVTIMAGLPSLGVYHLCRNIKEDGGFETLKTTYSNVQTKILHSETELDNVTFEKLKRKVQQKKDLLTA